MKGFRNFLVRGNVVDLAVGIVIGAAFTAVVNGFVRAFLTPLVGLATGSVGDYSNRSFTVSRTAFPFGAFLNAVFSFVLTATVLYFLVVLPVTKLHDRFLSGQDVEAPKAECPECLSSIPAAARRCSFCTAEVAGRSDFPAQPGNRI
ncbi:large conductance mechanosensitive channel protein MscL [Streptomyces sp. NPDC101152]|uniref:large conductance mechanosensitive channel protein MscL n=1 Tax=Streptomyces sp. NPDC101152 TaxID=3366116 RepID=UPI0037F68B63